MHAEVGTHENPDWWQQPDGLSWIQANSDPQRENWLCEVLLCRMDREDVSLCLRRSLHLPVYLSPTFYTCWQHTLFSLYLWCPLSDCQSQVPSVSCFQCLWVPIPHSNLYLEVAKFWQNSCTYHPFIASFITPKNYSQKIYLPKVLVFKQKK